MTLRKKIAQLEASQLTKVSSSQSLASRIIAGRGAFRPMLTRDQVTALGQRNDMLGSIGRGWSRIAFYLPEGTSPQPDLELDPEALLAATMGYLFDKPLEFVLFAFAWGEDPSMRVVELPEAYRARSPDVQYGPDLWACELLDQIGAETRHRTFNGRDAVEPIRMAVASGHGIGKSTITAFIILWIMSTRPNAKGTVTANTSAQLGSKTWAELGKWLRRCVTAGWFDMTTGKGSSRLAKRESPEGWRCDAQTSREENSESFAGQHAADSTSFYIFDEASAIPEKIWEVAEGGLSDGEPMFYAFGNPTRNTGAFHSAFNGQRHRWITRQIDSRSVALTNKTLIDGWISDYGLESDFVKVRVRGIFPSSSSLQFIGRDVVDDAMYRDLPETRGEVVIVGVDPARFGDDESVILTRVGRDARTWPAIRLRQVDTQQLAARVAEHVNNIRSLGRFAMINIDGGGVGGGVIDRLRAVGYDINEVQFGSRAANPKQYANKRAEMWGAMREWLKGGSLPEDQQLATELTSVEYGFNVNDQILLERKESMKSRGLASPDTADALAITFAVPVPVLEDIDGPRWDKPVKNQSEKRFDYNPMDLVFGHDPMKFES